MAWFALGMLAVGLGLMVHTGWPSYAVLLLVAVLIAAVGVGLGGIDAGLMLALPGRVVGLLEHDLLQAVALYAFVGALLRHGTLADQVMDTLAAVLHRAGVGSRQAQVLAGFGLGLLAAPMNGSVGAGIGMLSATAGPRWRRAGLDAADAVSLTAATATLGAIVPPSLVLLLLGDVMMRAHTEALQLAPDAGARVINTMDLVQACTPVAALLALAWAAVTAMRGHGGETVRRVEAPRPHLGGVIALLGVAGLLAGVAAGRVRAVEAAAAASMALCLHALASGCLRGGGLSRVLDDAMVLSGALFALLLAATTLSLVLRAAGCDGLAARGLAALQGSPGLSMAAVLGTLLLLAFVLDAFEIVFVVVPLVMPPLLAQVPDAGWVACLALLVLQAGFLLPPWGYAVALARSLEGSDRPPAASVGRSIVPYLLALAAVFATVWAWPPITHWLRSAPDRLTPQLDPDKVEELLRQMGTPNGQRQAAP